MTIDFIYSPSYLNWQLGNGHPTDPVRAENTLKLINAMGVDFKLIGPRPALRHELELVHDKEYVKRTLAGLNDEWAGDQPMLGDTACLMAGGTMLAVDRMLTGETKRAFNPQGAKHHAMRDRGSGFCCFNDMAMAARRFIARGMRVLYIDWDVHHGDGVEALLLDEKKAMTCSIHGDGFPGTGWNDVTEKNAYNWMLKSGSDGAELEISLTHILELGAGFRPDVVLLAAGADAHVTDPLGNLRFTVEDYAWAARQVSHFADEHCDGRILAGGAGGYQPRTWTPMIWATVVRELAASS